MCWTHTWPWTLLEAPSSLWGRTKSITNTGYLSHLTIWTHCSLPLMHANISAVWTACRRRNFSGFASWMVFCPWPKQARTCKKLGFLPFSYHSLYQMQNLQGNRYKWKATHEPLREFEEFSTDLCRAKRSAQGEEFQLKDRISPDYVNAYRSCHSPGCWAVSLGSLSP